MRNQLKLLLYVSLIIAVNVTSELKAQNRDSSHFTPVWQNNPFQPMTIIVSEATINTHGLVAGDEIGVFDLDGNGNEICVGSVTIEDSLTANHPAIVTASADDPTTPNIQDGFIDGNNIIFKLWDSDQSIEADSVATTYDPNYYDTFYALGTALVSIDATYIPALYTVSGDTIQNGQTKCYNATQIVTVADIDSGILIQPGGEATFIAGDKVILKPGFHAVSGSYAHAYITTTGDYCSNQQSMVSTENSEAEEYLSEIDEVYNDDTNLNRINIYPNPTTGKLNLDFNGVKTTALIKIFNFQGNVIIETKCNQEIIKTLDLSFLTNAMYFIVIKTENSVVTKKLIVL